MSRVVRAGGGVVWRPAPAEPEVVLVHRPRYDDWSLPKGKLDVGEHPLVAAVREVQEETGVRAVPQLRLPTVRYPIAEPDTDKVVEFWSMRAEAVEFRPADDEVDQLRWVPASRVAPVLSYDRERVVLAAYLAAPPVDGVVVLIRHARAGKRGQFDGSDDHRPLDLTGLDEAAQLAPALLAFAPARLVSATVRRCVETLEQLGLDVPVEIDARFDEGSDPAVAAEIPRELAKGPTTVVCSQGGMIPALLAALTGGDPDQYKTRKGEGWLLAFAGGEVVGADRLLREV